MSKLVKAFLVVAVIWIVVVGAGYFAWGQFLSFIPNVIQVNERAESTETITHLASGISRLSVDTKNGSVKIVAAQGSDIVINAFYTAHGNSVSSANDRLKELKTEVSALGSTLNVVGVYPSTTISNQSIRYEIAVPSSMEVKVKTSNGRIAVENITGRVDLRTSNGTIDVIAEAGPEEVLAYTSNGSINVTAVPKAGLYDLQTSNGTVTVALPESLGVSLKASTSNGSIDLGYGQWTFAGGQISNRNVTAQLGDGSLSLEIRTSNGRINLKRN